MKILNFLLVLTWITLSFLASSCQTAPPTEEEAVIPTVRDYHSFALPDRILAKHADIDWIIDFAQQQIRGSVTWFVKKMPGFEKEPLILDTKGLEIERVVVKYENAWVDTAYKLLEGNPILGNPLEIQLPIDCHWVKIFYRTTEQSSGLQWLSPAQTAGNKSPFLFTQAQPILARTFIPCQDTPSVRITYKAQVHVPQGLRAVMAAKQLEWEGEGKAFEFRMDQPIPSYLIALAVGDIDFRELGPRTGVYAEPSVVEAAAYEFVDTEKMITAVEKLYGPYLWERFDLIVLPPSFPYGGMENPRLTFATPTILAGDRSLVALVAHELAHSWSGNLVTNATWSDFWLNEGFTVYLERRIIESLYGKDRATMEAVLGRQDLQDDLQSIETEFTVLHVDLTGRDPDDAFSNVPYEKGYLFLRLLEETFGRKKFDVFLKNWFRENQFLSRTTEDFEKYVNEKLIQGDQQRAELINMHQWLYGPGLPENAPQAASDAFAQVAQLAKAFSVGEIRAEELPGKIWSTHEWLHFLRALPEDLSVTEMHSLDAAWQLTHTGNSEILMQWLLQTIRSHYEPAYPALEKFLTSQGRRKFLKPLYTEMAKTTASKQLALAIYRKARPMYHAISTRTIDEILHYEP